MQTDESHISDDELLAVLDGEAPGRDAGRIQAHLVACWQCRSRRAKLESTIAGFILVHQAPDAGVPPIDAARENLRARLRETRSPGPAFASPNRRQFTIKSRYAFGGIVAGAILTLGLVMYFNVQQVDASTPDAQLTPGVTRAATKEDVCSSPAAEGFYPIPATLAYRVFEKYRIRNPGQRSYEVDYLITPALGGADDIRNLWPQPYADGEWNAHVKDALEDHLHRQVCSGMLDLATAQRDISADWIAAYRKYFKTDRPLPHHEGFSVDPPWED
jgi:anti-sigma factor RsiW